MPRPCIARVQYHAEVDPVVYGNGTDGYERIDWLRLGFAALDQANVGLDFLEKVAAMVGEQEEIDSIYQD